MLHNKTIWWVLLVVWITGSAYWHVCKIEKLCDDPIIVTTIEPDVIIPPAPPLVIADSPYLKLEAKGNFIFAKNEMVANKTDVYPELDSLALYLTANPKKVLTITGQYDPEEKNTTTFPNLGLARANDIKNWLVSKRIPSANIFTRDQPKQNIVFDDGSFKGGVSFSFAKTSSFTDVDLANSQKFESIFKPLDLYFPTASSAYIKTSQNQKFISEAKKYISENSDKKLIITGHTDNEDSAEWNLALSKKRANVVKNQLIALGLSSLRIVAFGKGETEPKASNDTPEGKRANRRVTIVVR